MKPANVARGQGFGRRQRRARGNIPQQSLSGDIEPSQTVPIDGGSTSRDGPSTSGDGPFTSGHGPSTSVAGQHRSLEEKRRLVKAKQYRDLVKKQVGELRMTDARAKKLRKGASPDRVSHPLPAGAAVTPTTRDQSPRGIQSAPTPPAQRQLSLPCEAVSSSDLSLGSTSPPQQQLGHMLTPSTSVIFKEKTPTNTGALAGFSFASTSAAEDCVAGDTDSSHEDLVEDSIAASSFSDIEQEVATWERTLGDAGSDVEENSYPNSYEYYFIKNHSKLAHQFPATTDKISMKMLEVVASMDHKDDLHLHQLAGEDLDFTWESNPEIFTGQREEFTGEAGPTFESEGMTPLEIFQQIWDVSIMSLIVRETNRFAQQVLSNPNISRFPNLKYWYDITMDELWTFFGIMMLQSTVHNSEESEYWIPSAPYMRIGQFPELMTYHRFLLIKKCLHFVDNSQLSSSRSPLRLAKVMPIIDHLNLKFSSLYIPGQNIAIDESLLLWTGRWSWVESITSKAAREDIKTYELCESNTGYLWKVIVDPGKDAIRAVEEYALREETEPEGVTSKIVFDLMGPLLNKGHTLLMNNIYSSPLLSRLLKHKKTDTVCTLRPSREFVPEFLRQNTPETMRPGYIAFTQTKDMTIVVWRDTYITHLVSLISTYHKVEVGGKEQHGLCKYVPQVVTDYNVSMRGLDTRDQLLRVHPLDRVDNKVWYKKLFRRLLNVSIHNSLVIYNARARRKMTTRNFRFTLADEIIQKYRRPVFRPPSLGHFLAINDRKDSGCKVCSLFKIYRRTKWKCEPCDTSLCIPDCYRKYHNGFTLVRSTDSQ